MSKRSELITTRSLVKEILEQDPRTRNSDSFLYFKVLGVIAAEKQMNMNGVSIADFLLNMAKWGFPPFESVRRARQKLQSEFPELAACAEVQAIRDENEAIFREFSVHA